MEKYTSRFRLIMAAIDGFDIVRLRDDEYGLYPKKGNPPNDFKAVIYARGTKQELEALVEELTS